MVNKKKKIDNFRIEMQSVGVIGPVEVRRCGLPSRATFRKILLIKIHIMKAQDKGEL